MSGPTGKYHVVAGVDGSAPAEDALRWAAWHARLADGELEAVTVWSSSAVDGQRVHNDAEYMSALADVLARMVDKVVGDGDEVAQRVLRGHPAWALLATAAYADLLVVGNRGHGGFAGALLGSVSQYCVHYAPCPVVVVRENRRNAPPHSSAFAEEAGG